MKPVDVVVVGLLAVFAVRGFWRGFFRESFGFLALLVGIAAALRFTEAGAAALAARLDLPATARAAIAFVGIFMISHTVINLLGVLLDRVASSLLLRGVNRVAGAAFAVGKGGAILAFVLLFLHLFPVLPDVDHQIMTSRIGRPLVAAAGTVIRAGWQAGPGPDEPDQA